MNPDLRPHLVLRFAARSLVAFVIVGLALSWVLIRQIHERTEAAAEEHAEFVTNSVLRDALAPQDLEQPIRPGSARYVELAALMRSRILRVQFPVVHVEIWGPDGTVIFSDESRLVGERVRPSGDLARALRGEVISGVVDRGVARDGLDRAGEGDLFTTMVPLDLGTAAPAAVVEFSTDLSAASIPIARSFRLVGIALLGGLAAIYVLQLPLVRRLGRDLHDQNAHLEQLLSREQQTVSELLELNRMKGEFVDTASHELRTPLTSIVGYAKLLRHPSFPEDDRARADALEAIEKQAARLHRLVEDLLTAATLEDESTAGQVASVSPLDSINEVFARLGVQSGAAHVHIDGNARVIRTDPRLLEIILANLIDNAIKFSPPEVPFDVELAVERGTLSVRVHDRGPGIDPSEHARIFERFYQVDASSTRRHGGVGLGLYLVKRAVQRLTGRSPSRALPAAARPSS